MSHRSKYQQLPTEAINPATLGIDKASSADIVELMLNDDRKVLAAVQREKPRIAIGADIIVEALRKGGRVIFVGAGTSGRLGVVESAEMPTTFGTNPDSIQAVMAGGRTAFLLHGTSRAHKEWPVAQWIETARMAVHRGFTPVVTFASETERQVATSIVTAAPETDVSRDCLATGKGNGGACPPATAANRSASAHAATVTLAL